MRNALDTVARPSRYARLNPEAMQARAARIAHTERCRSLPPVRDEEAQQLIAAFLAARGTATRCPTAYAVPMQGV